MNENSTFFQQEIAELKSRILKYEQDGIAKLFYALNRKAWEMADMLNSISLKNIPLDDPKDKTFERIRFIINDSAGVAAAANELGKIAKVTGNEEEDTKKKPFADMIAESRD